MGTGAISAQLSHSNWKLFWKVKLPARILTCVWKIMQDSFPMFETLQRRGVMNSANCLMCDSEVESTSHLFLQCNFARVVWHGSALAIRTTELNTFSVKQWIWNYIKTKYHRRHENGASAGYVHSPLVNLEPQKYGSSQREGP